MSVKAGAATAAVIVVAAVLWWFARGAAAELPEPEARPADPEVAVIVRDDATEVWMACASSSWDEPVESHGVLLLETARSGWYDACVRAYKDGDAFAFAVTAFWTTEGGYAVWPGTQVDAPVPGPVTLEVSSSITEAGSESMISGTARVACEPGVEYGDWYEGWTELDDGLCNDSLGGITSEMGYDGTRAWWIMDRPSAADVTVHVWEMTLPAGSDPEFTFTVSDANGYVTVTTGEDFLDE
ncbi:hypothetical protein [Demequina zhanjiangensis]|uniref:Ig-like domain-containing protein n=1 Tax=Demequina zhanjiangensis TaxID=3051659 RepID=A0ABT8G3M8_9MICO|nr:hypothetical protein [Demequina sp. SYSU T00b26]MDN4473746.1 hypothetical protein [Demequina sp. SYSU T00b26]